MSSCISTGYPIRRFTGPTGLLPVRLRERIERHDRAWSIHHHPLLRKLARTGPVVTSLHVVAVGLGLTLRAATGNG